MIFVSNSCVLEVKTHVIYMGTSKEFFPNKNLEIYNEH
jgi:hypothetical protein